MKSNFILVLIGLFGAGLVLAGRLNMVKKYTNTGILLGSIFVFIGFVLLGVPLFLLFLTFMDYIFCNNSC